MLKANITRMPRPLGITALMVEYHNQIGDSKRLIYNRIKDLLIHHWTISNGSICGVYYNIDSLAHYLDCSTSDIQLYMRDKLLNTRIWDKEVQEKMLNALLGQQVAWTLEDRMDIQGQVNILRDAQGGQYKAFISGELNKALKLKLESTNSIQNILKQFAGTTNNLLIFTPGEGEVDKQGCTREEALNILYQKMDELNHGIDQSDAKYVLTNYPIDNPEEFPEVVASLQSAELSKKEATGLRNKEQQKIVDNYAFYRSKEADFDQHQLRRELEEGIDPDDEDPEIEEYPDVEE